MTSSEVNKPLVPVSRPDVIKTSADASLKRLGTDHIDLYSALLNLLRKTAEKKNSAPSQISLAWMLCKKPYIVSIPGTRKSARMKEKRRSDRDSSYTR